MNPRSVMQGERLKAFQYSLFVALASLLSSCSGREQGDPLAEAISKVAALKSRAQDCEAVRDSLLNARHEIGAARRQVSTFAQAARLRALEAEADKVADACADVDTLARVQSVVDNFVKVGKDCGTVKRELPAVQSALRQADVKMRLAASRGRLAALRARAKKVDLCVHTGDRLTSIVSFLGTPDAEEPGVPWAHGAASEDLARMGITTVKYAGVRICLRKGTAWSVEVTAPFGGTFHGLSVGASVADVQRHRGDPYSVRRQLTVSNMVDFAPRVGSFDRPSPWTWKDEEFVAYKPNSERYVIFELDKRGHVTSIEERDYSIRGRWEVMTTR